MSQQFDRDDSPLGFLFADIARLMRQRFQQYASESDLTYAQARALVYVARNEGLRQVELAELLEVQPITLARLIDQLQAEGLVERRADPSDRRAHRLYLCAAATGPLKQIRAVGQQVYEQMLAGLDKEERSALQSALKLIRHNLIND